VVLSRVGIEVRGRSRSLKVNYRTTDEIRQWACAQLEGCAVDDLDGNADSLRGYHSLTHGDAPEVIESGSLQHDVGHIKSILADLQHDGMEMRQVCITARTNDDLDGVARELQGAGIPTLRLDTSTTDDASSQGVRLATLQFANEVQTFLKEDYRTVKVEKNGKVSVVVYAGSDMLFQINLGDGSYTVREGLK